MDSEYLFQNLFAQAGLIKGIISNRKNKDDNLCKKVSIRPVIVNDKEVFQFTYEYKSKVLHKNLSSNDAIDLVNELLRQDFKQGDFYSEDGDFKLLVNKKGNFAIVKNKATKKKQLSLHNRKKKYILNDGDKIDFLIRLGIMSKDGKVLAKRYDKFKQINRYLEMVEDVIYKIKNKDTINIVDFGCGKSYLTFALYFYLVKVLKLNVNIRGLDLKEDVVSFCNELAKDLDYKGLKFIHGDIKDFNDKGRIDMVITLHACDTATDAAIVKALNWEADIIMLVPCCQHEIFDKIKNESLAPMLDYGIIKERLSSLVTDSLRANILEILGYKVQLLEFIDMEHTPKNILIRAIKTEKDFNMDAYNKYRAFKDMCGLSDLYIENQIRQKLNSLL